MPRLELGDGGNSFFDLKLIEQDDGFSVELCLRLCATVGRSVVVLYDVIKWGEGLENARDFIERLLSSGLWKSKMSDKSGFLRINWPDGRKNSHFEVVWHDKYGDISYNTRVSAENVQRFQSTVRAAWSSIAKR